MPFLILRQQDSVFLDYLPDGQPSGLLMAFRIKYTMLGFVILLPPKFELTIYILGGYMNYGYIRVSTDKQTVENQRFEINTFCQKQNLQIDGWIEETISGTKNFDKRKLGDLLKTVQKGDLIICAELSRLGRNLFMIMEILHICMNKECKVWTIKDNYRLGDDIQSKVLAFAFGLSAEIERNLISQRTKEALALRKAQGVKLGRKTGSRNINLNKICLENHIFIVSQIQNGISIPKIAQILGIAKGTLYRYLAYTDLRQPLNKENDSWKRGIY